MIQRVLLTFLLMLVPFQVAAPRVRYRRAHVSLAWNQVFPANGACGGAVTTSCISSFSEGYIWGALPTNTAPTACSPAVTTNCVVQLHSDAPAACTGTSCTGAFRKYVPILSDVVFYVATNGMDQNGNPVTTAAAASPPVRVSP